MNRLIFVCPLLSLAALLTPTRTLRFIVGVLVVAAGGSVVANGTSPPAAADGCGPGYYWSSSNQTCVESPDDSPSAVTAICQDGSDSHSQSAQGTCSHHGGVTEWCPCAGLASRPTNGIPVPTATLNGIAVSRLQFPLPPDVPEPCGTAGSQAAADSVAVNQWNFATQ